MTRKADIQDHPPLQSEGDAAGGRTVRYRRGPYRTGVARRRQILDAATTVFARLGYRSASLREIAEVVGVAPAAILRHYASKEILLEAVVADWWAREMERWPLHTDQGLAWFTRLPKVMRAHQTNPAWLSLYLILSAEATDSSHPAHSFVVKRNETLVESGAYQLRLALERGEIGPMSDEQIEREVRGLYALMDGLELQWLGGTEFDLADDFERLLSALVTRWQSGADQEALSD